MAPLTAVWTKVTSAPILQRSSQILGAVSDQIFIFGGELKPRHPRDNDVHVVKLDGTHPFHCVLERELIIHTPGTSAPVTTLPSSAKSACPSPRVGTATTVIGESIYIFSGRGGEAMAPIEENGALWAFNTVTPSWKLISPKNSQAPYPAARSYHAMSSDGNSVIYVHAGCPENGRLSDLWSFDVLTEVWSSLVEAPAPARGGASLAFYEGSLYRMNGFDGKTEQGGKIDIFSPERNEWMSVDHKPDNVDGPSPRSVGALLPLRFNGRAVLVTLFGEQDPSSLGHAGAGKMLSNVWAFDVETSKWQEVAVLGKEKPLPRGWFAADVVGETQIVVQGGLGEMNERLDDVWVLSF